MKLWPLLLLILLINSACSVYRSDGRKEFESLDFSKASFYLMNCQVVTSSKIYDDLLESGFEEETSSPFLIWSKDESHYLHVISLAHPNETCHWAFQDKHSFIKNTPDFIDMLVTTTSEESTTP